MAGVTDVFISYKREERDVARALAGALQQHGFSVWWDVELLAGDRFRSEITQILESARAAVVIWSHASVQSDFVLDEAQRAARRRVLVPVRIDDCELPLGHGQLHALDLRAWNREPDAPEMAALVASLRRLVRAAPAGAMPSVPPGPPAAAPAPAPPFARRAWLVGGLGVAALAAPAAWWWRHSAPVNAPGPMAGDGAASAGAASAVPITPPASTPVAEPVVGVASAVADRGRARPPAPAKTPAPAAAAVPRAPAPEATAAPSPALSPAPSSAPPKADSAPAPAAAPAVPLAVREVEINVRFAQASPARGQSVLAWLASRHLQASSTPLYGVPASVANRLYYSPDHADAAAWLRAGLQGTVELELQPFEATDAESRRQIRIVVGP